MIGADSVTMLVLTLIGLFVLFRVNRMIAKVQRRQLEEQVVREMLRESMRKRKLDELYGRVHHEDR